MSFPSSRPYTSRPFNTSPRHTNQSGHSTSPTIGSGSGWSKRTATPGRQQLYPTIRTSALGRNRTGGAAITRNMALPRAAGELVRVLDADDQLTAGALARDITTLTETQQSGGQRVVCSTSCPTAEPSAGSTRIHQASAELQPDCGVAAATTAQWHARGRHALWPVAIQTGGIFATTDISGDDPDDPASSPVRLPYRSIAGRRRPSVWLLNWLLRRTGPVLRRPR